MNTMRVGLMLAVLAGVVWNSPVRAQAECSGATFQTKAEVTVYESPPGFSTGRGWTQARPIVKLPVNTPVMVCERQSIGFLGSSKEWAKIAFEIDGEAGTGWIPVAGVLLGASGIGSSLRLAFVPALIGEARAQAARAAELAPPPDSGLPSDSPSLILVFVAILLGMAAKGVVDHIGSPHMLPGYLRDTLVAFLVSPMVFLTFAKEGDFQVSSTLSFIVFLCMAFQNGFFWQTVLAKPQATAERKSRSTPALTSTHA